MLIINADDWGRSRAETDVELECFRAGRITSVSAMVFMEDSERAASLAREHGVDAGLHLNLSQRYNGRPPITAAVEAHERLVRFLTRSKYAVLLYRPGLRAYFRAVFQSQFDEFVRLYGQPPSHVDGHQHRHLCANMLLDGIIPRGQKVRRNFSFLPGEKGLLNRLYRRCVDRWLLTRRYHITDYLFNLADCVSDSKLDRVFKLANGAWVELETHPCKAVEYSLLMSSAFQKKLHVVETAPYAAMCNR